MKRAACLTACLIVAVGYTACSDQPPIESTGESPQSLSAQPAAASARGPRPAYLISSTKALLEQTAAVIEGVVSDETTSFDAVLGPRTNVKLSGVKVLIGSLQNSPSEVVLPIFGGLLPDGSHMSATHLPRFAKGLRYVVFLANHDWFYSPIVLEYAFRVETMNGRDVLIDNDGHGVMGFDQSGTIHSRAVFAGRVAEAPFDPPALAAVDAAIVAATLSHDQFIAAVASYTTPDMLPTAFDGAFASAPMQRPWNKVATAPAAVNSASDAGEGGIK
jgi:hypothetical protein